MKPIDRFDRPWRHNSPKKKKKVKTEAVDQEALGAEKRLNKNMVTVELSAEHYAPQKPTTDLGGSILRDSDATFGPGDSKAPAGNQDLTQVSSLLNVKIPKSSDLIEPVMEMEEEEPDHEEAPQA